MGLFEFEERFKKQVKFYELSEEQLQYTATPKKCTLIIKYL